MQLRCEAVRSCALSGHASEILQVLSAEAGWEAKPMSPAVDTVLRCHRALASVTGSDNGADLSAAVLANALGLLKAEHDGRDPQVQEQEVPATTAAPGDPPHPGLEELEAWIHPLRQASGPLDDLLGIGLAQFAIETAPSLADFRGRLARMAVPMLLGRTREVPLGWSSFLLGHISDYRSLVSTGAGDAVMEAWLEFYLRGITESAWEAARTIGRAAQLCEEHRGLVMGGLGYTVSRALQVLERLLRQPLVTVADIRRVTGTSYVAANSLARNLLDLGILEETTGYRRNRLFVYGPYVRLVAADLFGATVRVAKRPRRTRKERKPPGPSQAAPAESRRSEPSVTRDEPRDPPAPPKAPETRTQQPNLADHLL